MFCDVEDISDEYDARYAEDGDNSVSPSRLMAVAASTR